MTDIDIDFFDRETALAQLPHVRASCDAGALVAHASGVYFQDIPVDPLTGLAALDYKEAEAFGYFKIDLLTARAAYEGVRDAAHLDALAMREPEWELLDIAEIVDQLTHIRNHFKLVSHIKPRSVEDLAVVIALIRPGKSHLRRSDRNTIDREIWQRPDNDDFFFKKSHAIAYALTIVVQLNRLVEDLF